jgi:hypothetical protein
MLEIENKRWNFIFVADWDSVFCNKAVLGARSEISTVDTAVSKSAEPLKTA